MSLADLHWRHVWLAGLVLVLTRVAPIPLAAAAAAVALARWWRWPQVQVKHYFTSRKWVLPAVAGVGGFGIDWVLAGLGLAMFVSGWLLAVACLAVVIFIFEGKIMNKTFSLVPADKQDALLAQLDELDGLSVDGQTLDLAGLDPEVVFRSIESRVIGQEDAVVGVVHAAFRRARLARAHKPVGVFLFAGPTGVGKTELAKALADELAHGRIVRIDCNELSESHSVQRLIGSPPGYVGSDQGGQLCRDLARVGSGVLLLDEIEKADPAALKVLMGLLDEARITEQSTGRVFSARGFLIVLTSNAAAAAIAKIASVEADPVLRETKVKDALQEADFLPEVLARIDAVFPFRPIAARDLARVVEKFLIGFAGDVGIRLESCDTVLLLDLVTRAKKTSTYGIREVVRSVENAVVDGLIRVKDAGYRDARIRVIDGRVSVEPVTPAAAAQAS